MSLSRSRLGEKENEMQKFNYQLAKEDIKGNLVLAQTLLRAHYPIFGL